MSRPMFNTTPSATNVLALKANLRLRQEASLKEYRLRFLVCHANMLDNISFSLADMQLSQAGSAHSTLPDNSLHNSSTAMSSANENVYKLVVKSQEQTEACERKADAFAHSLISNGEILINTPSFTDELVENIGYDLERTLSRQIDPVPEAGTQLQATSSGSDALVSNSSSISPSSHVSFDESALVRLSRVEVHQT